MWLCFCEILPTEALLLSFLFLRTAIFPDNSRPICENKDSLWENKDSPLRIRDALWIGGAGPQVSEVCSHLRWSLQTGPNNAGSCWRWKDRATRQRVLAAMLGDLWKTAQQPSFPRIWKKTSLSTVGKEITGGRVVGEEVRIYQKSLGLGICSLCLDRISVYK